MWERQRSHKSHIRVRARSLFRRRPCGNDGDRDGEDKDDTGYPKKGFNKEVGEIDDTEDLVAVEGIGSLIGKTKCKGDGPSPVCDGPSVSVKESRDPPYSCGNAEGVK